MALSGIATDLAAALDGMTDYTGDLTTDDHTLAQLNLSILLPVVLLHYCQGKLSGLVADLAAALDGMTDYMVI